MTQPNAPYVKAHVHDFRGSYSVGSHLNMEHHYIHNLGDDSTPKSELMAIHRELHMLEAMERPAFIVKTEPERVPWYYRVWPR